MNLERLEQVCRAACIKDMHNENILFLKDGQFVPIDLEVVTPRDTTYLYSTEDPKFFLPPLSPQEKLVIEKFAEAQKKRISRYVPIATSHFINNMGSSDGLLLLTDMILNVLNKNERYETIERAKKLILGGITDDFERFDIPIFLQNAEGIYYRSIKPENLIAQKRGVL